MNAELNTRLLRRGGGVIYRRNRSNICLLTVSTSICAWARSIEIVPVLVAIGVTETGQKLVLSLQAGDKESATSWREFFKDLKSTGTGRRESHPGDDGWIAGTGNRFQGRVSARRRSSVAKSMWPGMFWPRCPRSSSRMWQMTSTFHLLCPVTGEAWECFEGFRQKWQKSIPSAVECLERNIDACLTFFNFPRGGMDFVKDYQHYRAAQQRVQTSDQGHGDRSRRDRLLSDPGLHIFENGDCIGGQTL